MAWSFLLTDIKTDATIADVTELCLTSKVSARLNRPMSMEFTMPADDQTVLATFGPDGDAALTAGTRAIKAYQDGVLRGHCIVWTLSWSGGTDNDPKVDVTCLDPLIRLQYRYVFDSTGQIADYDFGTTYTGGNLLRDVISYSRTYEDNLGSPALLPIDTFTGVDTSTTNLASVITDSPMTIGDLVTALTDTGVFDVVLTPVDSSGAGYAAGIMAQLNTYEEAGSDISATVHFDYATGLKNVEAARRVIDASTLGNRVTFEIGPKRGPDHWQANVTGTETGPTTSAPYAEDLTAWQALQLASRAKYGTYSDVRTYDSGDYDAGALPLWHRLWKTEVNLRVNPRDLVYLTPRAWTTANPNFRPFIDYNLGDIVGINGSTFLGPAITNAKQRIYGFDVSIEDGVERVAELVTSADAEGGAG